MRFCYAVLFLFLSSVVLADIPQDILNRLNSENEDEEMDACLVLGNLGSPEAIPVLKEKLRNSSMLVRHSAANALAKIGGTEVNEIFKQMISSQSIEKKRIGLAGLAMTGDPNSIELVLEQLDNPDWQVRWSAVYALGQWGYRPAVPKLKEIAESDTYFNSATNEYTVRKTAEDVVKKIKSSIEWYRKLSDANLLSSKFKKPVLVYWFINDDQMCRKMDEDIFISENMSDIAQNFVCVRLNAQAEGENVFKYDVNAVPCIIALDKDGNEVDRIVGIVARDELINRLKKVLENKGTPKEWKENIAKNPNDVESSWHLAEWFMDNNKMTDAISLLENVIKNDTANHSGYADNAIFSLGYILGLTGQYKQAIDFLEDLRVKYPNYTGMDKALYCLGLDYLSLKKPEKAKKVFLELIDLYPESKTVNAVKEILKKI